MGTLTTPGFIVEARPGFTKDECLAFKEAYSDYEGRVRTDPIEWESCEDGEERFRITGAGIGYLDPLSVLISKFLSDGKRKILVEIHDGDEDILSFYWDLEQGIHYYIFHDLRFNCLMPDDADVAIFTDVVPELSHPDDPDLPLKNPLWKGDKKAAQEEGDRDGPS